MSKMLKRLWEIGQTTFYVVGFLFCGYVLLQIWAPFFEAVSPVVTFLVWLLATVASIASGKLNASFAIVGSVLFLVSFPAVAVIGVMGALLIWSAGVLSQFWAFGRACTR